MRMMVQRRRRIVESPTMTVLGYFGNKIFTYRNNTGILGADKKNSSKNFRLFSTLTQTTGEKWTIREKHVLHSNHRGQKWHLH